MKSCIKLPSYNTFLNRAAIVRQKRCFTAMRASQLCIGYFSHCFLPRSESDKMLRAGPRSLRNHFGSASGCSQRCCPVWNSLPGLLGGNRDRNYFAPLPASRTCGRKWNMSTFSDSLATSLLWPAAVVNFPAYLDLVGAKPRYAPRRSK